VLLADDEGRGEPDRAAVGPTGRDDHVSVEQLGSEPGGDVGGGEPDAHHETAAADLDDELGVLGGELP
jgi:hypothetical protein